jgi:hypothetical protein
MIKNNRKLLIRGSAKELPYLEKSYKWTLQRTLILTPSAYNPETYFKNPTP